MLGAVVGRKAKSREAVVAEFRFGGCFVTSQERDVVAK